MCHPWPIVALGNVLLPRPLQPAGSTLFLAVRLTIKGLELRPASQLNLDFPLDHHLH